MTEVDMLQTMAQMDIPPEEFDLTQPGVAEMALLSTMAPKVRSNPYPIYHRPRETDPLHLRSLRYGLVDPPRRCRLRPARQTFQRAAPRLHRRAQLGVCGVARSHQLLANAISNVMLWLTAICTPWIRPHL